MPGIFSWKNRLLGRKTPEPERVVHVTIPPEEPKRNVRFDEKSNSYRAPSAASTTAETSSYIQEPTYKPETTAFRQEPPLRQEPNLRAEPAFRPETTFRPPAESNFRPTTAPDWQNDFGEARVIASINPLHSGAPKEDRSADWRYADDVRVSITPLSPNDTDGPRRFASPAASRGSSVLQNLREQKEHLDMSERRRQASTLPPSSSLNYRPDSPQRYGVQPGGYPADRSATSPRQRNNSHDIHIRLDDVDDSITSRSYNESMMSRHLDNMNVVFLQANDEVKRAILPSEVSSLDQVRNAFVRVFPNVTSNYIYQPQVKIYIQEPSKGQLFYELDDPHDIKNKSVLKLKEHTLGVHSPSRLFDHPDYHSENENDDERRTRFFSLARPASAMAQAEFATQKAPRQKSFDHFVDPYASDTSSHDSRSVTRSGSATPVIDRDSRVRMETMERQLAGLSSLVHSALVSKGMSESAQRDMADLRREILALHPDTIRETSEEPASIPESLSSHAQHQLGSLRNRLQQASAEMRQLRRTAQVNAQQGRNIIKEAGEQINAILAQRTGHAPIVVADARAENRTRHEHAERLAKLLEDLTSFEENVEAVRSSVLKSNRKLRMSEVESLTENLTQIGRTAAALKTEFPSVQESIEAQIKRDMERVVREEKFIRDQTMAVDQSLRRCKALANIMVTMKKLALVQDPAMQRTRKKDPHMAVSASYSLPKQSNGITVDYPQTNGNAATVAERPPSVTRQPVNGQSGQPVRGNAVPTVNGHNGFNGQATTNGNPATPAASQDANGNNDSPPPTAPPPPPPTFQSPVESLDGVLEEVGRSSVPPRPPSRFSVQDVRTKFTKPPELPEHVKSMIDDVARRASPALDRDNVQERRHDLEERQVRLAEKQRQLKSQFDQLQQLTHH